LIGVLIIVVVGAICFWAIDKFATDSRLEQFTARLNRVGIPLRFGL
jgi:hypothetical protein